MHRSNNICLSCLGTVCKCGKHRFVTYSTKGRVPKSDASNKEWVRFIEMFLSYDAQYKATALDTLKQIRPSSSVG